MLKFMQVRNYLVNLFVILSILFLMGTLYLLFFPYKIIKVNKLPYPILTPTVKSSQGVVLDVDYCKYYPFPAVYSVQFREEESSKITTIGEKYSSDLETGCKHIGFKVKIPEDLDPGTYTLKMIVRYRVNPLRTESYSFTSEKFIVVKDETEVEKLDKIISIIDSWELDK